MAFTFNPFTGNFDAVKSAAAIDHGLLAGLADDDHTQYLLLAGRAGGQSAIGGTAAGDALTFRGSSDADLGDIFMDSPIKVDIDIWSTSGSLHQYSISSTFTTSAAFIGGGYAAEPTIGIGNGVFIWEGVRGTGTFTSNVSPAFAAMTLFQALPVMQSSIAANRCLPAIILNGGPTHEAIGAINLADSLITIVSAVPKLQALTSGGNSASDITGMNFTPSWNVVSGATVDFNECCAIKFVGPKLGLFANNAGTKRVNNLYGIRATQPDSGLIVDGEYAVISSNVTTAANRFFIKNDGNAVSQFAGQIRMNDNIPILYGTGLDVAQFWDAASSKFIIGKVFDAEALRYDFDTTNNLITIDAAAAMGIQFDFNRISFGSSGNAANSGNTWMAWTFPSGVSTSVNGEYGQFLLTQANNLTIDDTISGLYTWVVNPVSVTIGTGSLTGYNATLRLGGQISAGDSDKRAASYITGRSRFDGILNYRPTSPGQITSDQNNYAISTGNGARQVIRLSTDASRTITGIVIEQSGDSIIIVNVGAFDLVLADQNASSTATNRIISPTGANLTLGPEESAHLWHDETTDRWRITYHTGA